MIRYICQPSRLHGAGQAKSVDVLQMQALVVDLDAGDIPAKLNHLLSHLGKPTLIIESGGRTSGGASKLHVWWRMTEPAKGAALAELEIKVTHYQRVGAHNRWPIGGFYYFSQESTLAKIQPV